MTQPISCTVRQLSLRYLLDRARGAVGRMYPYFLIDVYVVGRVTCCATDLKVGIISELDNRNGDTTVEMGGTVCVSAGKFFDIISALPDLPVMLKGLDNDRLQIECGRYSGVLPCVDPEKHFPDMTAPGGDPDVTVAGGFLNDIYAAIGHAVGNDEEKATSGVYLQAENGRLTGVATNGHRLSLAAVSVPYDGECEPFNAGVTMSPRALGEIKKLNVGHADVRFRDNRMSIEQTNITVIARLFESKYPPYRRVIPTTHPHCTVVNAKALIEIIERVAVLNESQGIMLNIRETTIRVTGGSSSGDICDTVDCETEGAEAAICITPAYLLEALKSLRGTEDVIIKYLDDKASLLILPADHSNWDERIELIQPRKA